MEKFSERLKYLRKSEGLTQKQLAEILKTNNSCVCDWERGRSEPDLFTVVKIACYFDVSTDYLLGLENDLGEKIKPN